jgi:hypothetical protein
MFATPEHTASNCGVDSARRWVTLTRSPLTVAAIGATYPLNVEGVGTLGGRTLRPKPGPTSQVTTVLIQSTRGGTATATLAR